MAFIVCAIIFFLIFSIKRMSIMIIKEIEKGILHLSRNDNRIATLIKKNRKCNLHPHNDYFISLLGSIIQQQLSIKAADSIYGRFLDLTGKNPTPEIVLNLQNIQLRNCGLSNSKVKYVKDLSSKVINKEISLVNLDEKDEDEIITELTRVKGIGVWTVHMFLIFTLGRLNVLPTGDLGIKKSIKLNYNLRKMPTEKKVYDIARRNKWEPYCSIASWYLWASLDEKN